MAGAQDDDAIRAEPVIRYLANAELSDPLWRDERIVPSIFPSPYRVLFEALVLAYKRELPRTSAIIARCALELGTALSESLVEDIIRGAEQVDSTGITAQVELLIQERDRKAVLGIVSTAMRDLSEPGANPARSAPLILEASSILNASDNLLTILQPVDVFDALEADFERRDRGQLNGLSSGMRGLDRITNGFPPQFLVVIGARVSVGKSAFAMQLGRLYVMQRRRVMYFSLELPRRMFLGRWLAQAANISYRRWQSNMLDPIERDQLKDAIKRSREPVSECLSLYAAGELREQTRDTIIQLVMREPKDRRPEVIVIDLITNLRPVPSERSTPPWERFDRDTEILRNLAMQTNATIFAVCQLNRDLTKRRDKRPQLSDIRASGAIEQNADQVILMDNPDIVGAMDRGVVLGEQQRLFLNVNKNRNGGSGNVEALWVASSMTIRDLEFTTAAWGTTGRSMPVDDDDVNSLFNDEK